MVQWPCILKLEGDSELIFLASEQALSSELDGLIFSSSDCLIDGLGQTYQVKSCRMAIRLNHGIECSHLTVLLSLFRSTSLLTPKCV